MIHGDKYDYSKSNYINSVTKTTIICPIHGEFQQMPIEHMRGQGCPKCKFDSQRNLHGFDDIKTYFLTKAKEVHGDKYDYSKVELEYISQKVCIICPVHGEFWQIPNAHLQGVGCPQCGYRKQNCELKIAEILKSNGITYKRHAKFEWLGRQNVDFYLPDYNIAIEYQGLQHFKPIKFYGGEKAFDKTIERDKRKYMLCKENNLKLMYVSFEKELPKTYLDEIYNSENELIKNIKKYVNH